MTPPAPPRSLYFDWNATTPPHEDVLEAMRRAAAETWGNPASVHRVGRAALGILEKAREALAAIVSAHPRDVVFTSGGTEANNLAIAGAATLVVSRIEHPSVVRPAENAQQRGRSVAWLPVPPSGRIEAEQVSHAVSGLGPGFTLALMAVNHETGVVQPVSDVARVVHERGGRLHVDAVQALGKIEPAHFVAADSLAFAAHKIRGPKGIGALVWKGSPPPPVLLGGAQERGVRPGTVDPVAVAGFAAALARVAGMPERYRALAPLRDRLEAFLAVRGVVNGLEAPRVAHVTNVSMQGHRGDELVAALDLEGLHVASGSACSAGTAEPSAVIAAMAGPERARAAVRVSLGEATTSSEVDQAIAVLKQVVTRHPSRT